ncbi:MAG: efflux RND transporter periplasmic adaptor subunit [Lachnospiraceae bacterium]|nr:efflux RND transporter periplasmic adaptor subunit [Lachnospiraceae bacterium]
MSKLGKIVAGAVGLGAVAALGVLVYTRINKPEEPVEEIPLPAVQIHVPEAGNIELRTELMGTVEPADVVYVIPKGAGEVLEVYVNQGDHVEKNQKLFRIDNKQLDAARITLDQAKLALNDAQASLNRMQVLYESGDISAQAYESTVNGVSQAKLQLKSAQLNHSIQLENSTVTAPIAGLLEQFDVEVHDMVSSAGAAAMISGGGSKSASFSVTERVVKGLAVGDSLTLEKNGMEYTGVITEIGTMIDAATGLFKVKASLAEAEGLATGTMVKLYVTAQRAENVMTVPVDCVSYANGDAFVYTYDETTQSAKKVLIEQGLMDADKVEVRSGLSWDDQVVVTWSKEIYDGATVRLSDGERNTQETKAAETDAETKETEKDAQ